MNLKFDSALYWFPRIERIGLHVPRTVLIQYNHKAMSPIFDGLSSLEYDKLYYDIEGAIQIIGLPAFLRSDVTSAKHRGIKACKVDSLDSLNAQLCETLKYSELKTLRHHEKPSAIMVREFLNLEHAFTAFGDFPISNEYRLFANANGVCCIHPYWPESAISGYTDDSNWKIKLENYKITNEDTLRLSEMAIRAADAMGNDLWSVDFAKDVNGSWWLIDMALAENSFHWPGCKNAN